MFTKFIFMFFVAFALAACGSGSDHRAPAGNQGENTPEEVPEVEEAEPLITFIPEDTHFYLNRFDWEDSSGLFGNQQTGNRSDFFAPFPQDKFAMASLQCNVTNRAVEGGSPTTTFYTMEAKEGIPGFTRTYYDPVLGSAEENAREMMASTQLTKSLIEDVLNAMEIDRSFYVEVRSQVAPLIIVNVMESVEEGWADEVAGSATGEYYSLYDLDIGFAYPELWDDMSESERKAFTRAFFNGLSADELSSVIAAQFEYNTTLFSRYNRQALESPESYMLGEDKFYCVSTRAITPIPSYFGVIIPVVTEHARSSMSSDYGDGLEFEDGFYTAAVVASVAHVQQSLVTPYYSMTHQRMTELIESPLPEWFRLGQQYYVASKVGGGRFEGLEIRNSDSLQHPFDILVSESGSSRITGIHASVRNIDKFVAYRYLVEANGEQGIIDMMMDIRTCDKEEFYTTEDGISACFQDAFERHMVDDKGTRLTLERFRVDYQNLINRD